MSSLRFSLLLLALIALTACQSTTALQIVSHDEAISDGKDQNRAYLEFQNRVQQPVTFSLFRGYDGLFKGLDEKQQRKIIAFNQARVQFYKSQVSRIAKMQKQLENFPPYLVEIHLNALRDELEAEEIKWRNANPYPEAYLTLIHQVFKEIYSVEDESGNNLMTREDGRITLSVPKDERLIIATNNQRLYNAIELVELKPEGGKLYQIEYDEHLRPAPAFLKGQREGQLMIHNILRIYEGEGKERKLLFQLDPHAPVNYLNNRFHSEKYQLLMTLFERLY